MIGHYHLTKKDAEKVLKTPKFGDHLSIAAVRQLSVPARLEEFLENRGCDPDKLSLQEINELAEQMGYEPEEA